MPIPSHKKIMIPILEYLQDGKIVGIKDFVEPMSEIFNLTNEEKLASYSKGKLKFANKVYWALSYLYMANLVDKPKRGIYKINSLGLKKLENKNEIEDYVVLEVRKRHAEIKDQKSDNEDLNDNSTPEESLYESFDEIKSSIYSEIIQTILTKSPYDFEHVVVQLLQKMGYGGELKDSGEVTKYSNDGGIDGIIKEDILGLGRIHIQAKRYQIGSNISREDIQKFVGALAVAQSNKGVFITTSNFSRGAKEYVKNLNSQTTIVLINGEQLAEYIYDFGLGMQTQKVIEIKSLDSDFWDELKDDERIK